MPEIPIGEGVPKTVGRHRIGSCRPFQDGGEHAWLVISDRLFQGECKGGLGVVRGPLFESILAPTHPMLMCDLALEARVIDRVGMLQMITNHHDQTSQRGIRDRGQRELALNLAKLFGSRRRLHTFPQREAGFQGRLTALREEAFAKRVLACWIGTT